jgi:hypothetical protein
MILTAWKALIYMNVGMQKKRHIDSEGSLKAAAFSLD